MARRVLQREIQTIGYDPLPPSSFRNQERDFVTMGVIVSGAKRGLILGFVMVLILGLLNNAIHEPDIVSDINKAMAMLFLSLIASIVGEVLGAVGGIIGKKIFK